VPKRRWWCAARALRRDRTTQRDGGAYYTRTTEKGFGKRRKTGVKEQRQVERESSFVCAEKQRLKLARVKEV
jgi:hypothetical protein